MAPTRRKQAERRKLLERIEQQANIALFGTLSETYSKCGNRGCRCHAGGPKHGPYLHVSHWRDGRTQSYHVPKAAHDDVRRAIQAWHELETLLRELSELNKQDILARAKEISSS